MLDKVARAILSLPLRAGSKLEFVERAVLHHAIEMCAGNKTAAARLIGVDRLSLHRKWERMADEPPGGDDTEPSDPNANPRRK